MLRAIVIIGSIISISLLPLGGGAIGVSSTLICIIGALLIVMLVNCRFIFCSFLTLFLTYSLLPIALMQSLAGVRMSSWREEFPLEILEGGLTFYTTFLCLFYLALCFSLPKLDPNRIPPTKLPGTRGKLAVSRLYALVFSALAILALAGESRDAWISEAGLGDRFIMQSSLIGLVASFALNTEVLRRRKQSLGALDYVPLFTAAVIAVQGFRFVFVAILLVFAASQIDRLRLSLSSWILLILGSCIAYIVLIVGMGVRAVAGESGMGLLEAIDQLDLPYLALFIGVPEQTNMLALSYFLEYPPEPLWGITYVDALIRVAPNFIHSNLFDTIRPQDFILQNFLWVSGWFRSANLNIGAHIILEGIINFGKNATLLLGIFVAVFAVVVDTRAVLRGKGLAVRYALCAFSYAIAWYGSAVSFKYILFMLAVYQFGYILVQMVPTQSSEIAERGIR